ncbi:hypothetical protein [Cellulomonas sp. ICMP 17802]|uniref:hypothetical protein n=1 Tax=Cellulomonas sp. ICMP 17802 TaxID=3239199 RepID=UPI00351B5D00
MTRPADMSTRRRMIWLVVGLAVGAVAVWAASWWILAAMAIQVLRLLAAQWQARNADAHAQPGD